MLNAVAASGAELVFFPVFEPEGDHIVLQAGKWKVWRDVTLMSAEGLYFDAFMSRLWARPVWACTSMRPPQPEGPAYDAFVSRYEDKYGEPPIAHPTMPTPTMRPTCSSTPLRRWPCRTKMGRCTSAARPCAMPCTPPPGIQGLTGSLTCDEYGDCGAIRLQGHTPGRSGSRVGKGWIANVVYTYSPDQ